MSKHMANIVVGAALAALCLGASATLLSGTSAEQPVMMLGVFLAGLVQERPRKAKP